MSWGGPLTSFDPITGRNVPYIDTSTLSYNGNIADICYFPLTMNIDGYSVSAKSVTLGLSGHNSNNSTITLVHQNGNNITDNAVGISNNPNIITAGFGLQYVTSGFGIVRVNTNGGPIPNIRIYTLEVKYSNIIGSGFNNQITYIPLTSQNN